jgi:hypothetical protein
MFQCLTSVTKNIWQRERESNIYNWVSERITNKGKILRRSGEGVKGRCLPWSTVSCCAWSKEEEGIGQGYSAKVAFSIFQSMKRIQPLLVCAGFFICIRKSLDRPCVTMPSRSSPLKCFSVIETDTATSGPV